MASNSIGSLELAQLLVQWQRQLVDWSASGQLAAAAEHWLSPRPEGQPWRSLLTGLSQDTLTLLLPPIQLLPPDDMPTARGAYAAATGTAYLNLGWWAEANDADRLAVLSEELGHHLEARYGSGDSRGDEGQRFAAELLGRIGGGERDLETQGEDRTLIRVDGVWLEAEAAALTLKGSSDNDTIRRDLRG